MANKSYNSSEMGGESSHWGDPEFHKDFNGAYSKLVEKLYQDQGSNYLLSQDEIHKLEHAKELNEEGFRARITEFEDRKKTRLEKMQDYAKDKELEGCTFKPELVTEQNRKRTLKQFLDDQSRFVENVKLKTESVAKDAVQLESQMQHPVICE